MRHFIVLNCRLFEENAKNCNPTRALLRHAIQMLLTWLDEETLTAMCVVDRIDLLTLVIKGEVHYIHHQIVHPE